MADWFGSLDFREPVVEVWNGLRALSPRIAGSIAVLALGYALARLASTVGERLLVRWERTALTVPAQRELHNAGLESLVPRLVGGILFWTVALTALATAGQILGLPTLTEGVSTLSRILPVVVLTSLVVVGGIVLGNVARAAVTRASAAAGAKRAALLGRLARAGILLTAFVVALDQIGLDSRLLISGISILFAAVVGSLALAFAFGARETVGNMIALHYMGQAYRVGDTLSLGDVEGRVVELRATGIVLDTSSGRTFVPGSRFAAVPSTLRREPKA
jgi:small-conductance mechanosensitive channel